MKFRRGKIPRGVESISLLVALCVVMVIAVLSYRVWVDLRHRSEDVSVSEQLTESNSALLSALKDAETGQRGFLLTGREQYLEPYQKALVEIFPAYDRLFLATDSLPDQRRRVEALKPLVSEKLDELRQTVELRRNEQIESALALVRSDRGKIVMDQIRRQSGQIQSVAYKRLRQQAEEAGDRAHELGLISTIGSLVLFALILLSGVSIQRATTRRQQLIHNLQQSAEETREAREWLETTIRSIGDGVVATDRSGNVKFLNRIAQALTGWAQEDAVGKPLEDIFIITNEDTGATVENPATKALREGRVIGLANHTNLTARDGNCFPIDDSAAPIRAGDGSVSGVVLVFRDITERRKGERAIRESAERLRFMAESMPQKIFTATADGSVDYLNQQWTEFTGLSIDQIKDWGWTQFIHPDDVEENLRVWKHSVTTGEPFQLMHRFRRADMTYRWHLSRAHAMRNENGGISMWIGSNTDIHEQKENEEKLNRHLRQLDRSNADLQQFAFAASHDLQEPLRMVTSYSQLLVKGYRGQLESEAGLCVKFIMDGTQRMRTLLEDLLAYTQLSMDENEKSLVDLNGVFQKAVENCRAAIEESKAVVTSETLPSVLGYEPHFVQLIQNLISNALKYRGAPAPRIQVSAAKQDGAWCLAVADNGIGIAPEYHQKIFGVFKRLHGKDIPGTGIGLAICQRVVDRYGGRIWVESELDRGATFYCTLPGTVKASA